MVVENFKVSIVYVHTQVFKMYLVDNGVIQEEKGCVEIENVSHLFIQVRNILDYLVLKIND